MKIVLKFLIMVSALTMPLFAQDELDVQDLIEHYQSFGKQKNIDCHPDQLINVIFRAQYGRKQEEQNQQKQQQTVFVSHKRKHEEKTNEEPKPKRIKVNITPISPEENLTWFLPNYKNSFPIDEENNTVEKKLHQFVKPHEKSSQPERFHCPLTECGCSYTRPADVKDHFVKHHSELLSSYPAMQPCYAKYKCTECNLEFARRKSLDTHERTHMKKKKINLKLKNASDYDDQADDSQDNADNYSKQQ